MDAEQRAPDFLRSPHVAVREHGVAEAHVLPDQNVPAPRLDIRFMLLAGLE